MLNLGEELLLLGLRDEKGTVISSASTSLPYGLSGAVLMELALGEKLRIGEKGDFAIADETDTGDDILDEALSQVRQSRKVRKAEYWVQKLNSEIKDLKGRLLNRLVHKGILRREEHRILWVIPANRYPTEDPAQEQEVRARIRKVILEGGTPDSRTAILIGLMNACDLLNEVFSREERKDARRRAKEISAGSLIGKAISDTVAGIQAAIIAATVAATAASTSSSG